MGSSGTLTELPEQRVAAVAFEWPQQQLVTPNGFSKQDLERLHIERFRTDFTLLTGQLPFYNLAQTPENQDPPDFTFDIEDRREGLDCIQLTIPSRRQINATFRVVREAVLRADRQRMSHLVGHVVYMWFHEDDMRAPVRMPPRGLHSTEVQLIIDALANYQIDPEAFTFDPREHPEGMPQQINAETLNFSEDLPGLTFYAMPMSRCVPETYFYYRMGFELGMAYSTLDRPDDIGSELIQKLISHDREQTQHVLVTIGGPDRYGFTFPAETYLAEQMLLKPPALPKLEHIKEVALHFWHSGQIVGLLPQYSASNALFPGGYVPAAYHVETTVEERPNMRYEGFIIHEQ